MKIIEVRCKGCKAVYETLESIPRDGLSCPGCGSQELTFKKTDKEFTPCSGSCNSCGGSCHE